MYRVFYRNSYSQNGRPEQLPCKLMERDFISATEAMIFAEDLFDFDDIKIYSDDQLIWSSTKATPQLDREASSQLH